MLPPSPTRGILRGNDIADFSRDIGVDARLNSNRNLADAPLHRGQVTVTSLGRELSVHTVDVLSLEDFTTDVEMPPSISVSFVLNGGVTMEIGGNDLTLGVEDPSARCEGGYLLNPEPLKFLRRAHRGQRLRAAVVVASPEWLSGRMSGFLGDPRIGSRFSSQHPTYGKWPLSPRVILLAEQLLQPPQFEPFLHQIMLESWAIAAIGEGLRAATGAQPAKVYSLRARERDRLEAIKTFIESDAASGMTLTELARHFGTNVKALQDDFRVTFGSTIFSYLKNYRLERAHEALRHEGVTVAEAAHLAGYVNPANFATAFRKRFGMSPRDVRIS